MDETSKGCILHAGVIEEEVSVDISYLPQLLRTHISLPVYGTMLWN
jgi:hypothetical protein